MSLVSTKNLGTSGVQSDVHTAPDQADLIYMAQGIMAACAKPSRGAKAQFSNSAATTSPDWRGTDTQYWQGTL